MTRVLHVLDQPTAAGEALTLALSADAAKRRTGERHAWLLLGGGAMADAADAAGLTPDRYKLLPRPTGLRTCLPGANRTAGRLMRAADRVECWTVGAALHAAQLACPHFVPRFGQATLCAFAEQTSDATRLNPLPSSQGPGARAGSPQPGASIRATVRQRLAIDDDTVLIALLADRPERVDAGEAWLATLLTYETLVAHGSPRQDVRLLCHPFVQRRVDAIALAGLLGRPELLIQDAALASPWAVLPGCDLAMAPDPINAGLSILWAQAAGLPIIAPPEPRLPGLESIAHLRVAQTHRAKWLSRPLTQWVWSQQVVHAS